jgi:hypothetical protein
VAPIGSDTTAGRWRTTGISTKGDREVRGGSGPSVGDALVGALVGALAVACGGVSSCVSGDDDGSPGSSGDDAAGVTHPPVKGAISVRSAMSARSGAEAQCIQDLYQLFARAQPGRAVSLRRRLREVAARVASCRRRGGGAGLIGGRIAGFAVISGGAEGHLIVERFVGLDIGAQGPA